MNEAEIENFWQQHPCGDDQIGRLDIAFAGDHEAFFRAYDAFRYKHERHILRCLDHISFENKNILEIGLGQGADSEQMIRRGARWSGLDLTAASVRRVETRLRLRDLPFDTIKQGSVLDIPYNDNSFDIVFSHGVLHHVPEISLAQNEIARVLKPNGELVMMVYAKWSLNYVVGICLLRRIGLALMYVLGLDPGGIYGIHLKYARERGLFNYLKLREFIHRNTDGPDNPYSKLYGVARVREDFRSFSIVRSYKRFMHCPPLPISLLPLGWLMGWHLWVHLVPRIHEKTGP
jgi:SAM-dependent methyltransferase